MAYIVFLISKDEKNATVTSALGALIAVTLAILLTLGLELIDTAEPALRLPLMAMATFAAMFTARTFALGPISYLAGFVIVLLQTLVDDVPSPEALTRADLVGMGGDIRAGSRDGHRQFAVWSGRCGIHGPHRPEGPEGVGDLACERRLPQIPS